MKKLFLLILISLIISSCESYHLFKVKVNDESVVDVKSVPADLINNFNKKYPGAKVEKWYKIKGERYVVRYSMGGPATYAVYSEKGILEDDEVYDQDYDEYEEYDDYLDWDWGDRYD
ncbi:MAG TPA: hypothetical protein PKK00_05045 [Bacteroidales bacterium]|nr:hypothetical protein [Bacteroidales bacterium]HPS16726.1 hypothetical protein [Bacteroidales bacterium]